MVVTDEEVWQFVPPYRYLFMSDYLSVAKDYIDKVSPLSTCAYYRPLTAGVNLVNRSIYVERHRDRGIGDILFMTGVLDYLKFMTAGALDIYFYSLSDRGTVLFNHPALKGKTPYYGPVIVDSLNSFDYHWIVPCLTEVSEERDQFNVYDALYTSIGLDPRQVDPKFKRPSAELDYQDHANLDSLFHFTYSDRGVDLRKTPYYVIAPFCYSALRTMPYSLWVRLLKELSDQRPVIVLGTLKARMPVSDMTAQDFVNVAMGMKTKNPVICLVGDIPLRLTMSIIFRARCLITLDSGLLYVAEAFRTPAISIWGPVHPGVRLGYDKEYMDLAVWNFKACSYAPCYAYSGFPTAKCPRHELQRVCEVLNTTDLSDILAKLDMVEKSRPSKVTAVK
jgi:ADP-heptose:LPS heptosyltransferase